MTSPLERLAELGIELPAVPAPVASYIPAVRSGRLVLTSGQLPMRSGSLITTGKVGAGVSPDEAAECARQCALNALAAVHEVVPLDQVVRIVKLTVFVASTPEFSGQAAVANGASSVVGDVFGDAGRHARSAVGVAVLPLDAPVEVELMVEVG